MPQTFHPFPVGSMARALLGTLILLAIALLIRDYLEPHTLVVLLVIIAVGAVVIAGRFASSRFKSIELGERTITYQSGILSSRKITLAYDKITEASFYQHLMDRVFGVGTLSIDTAGGTPIAIRVQDIRSADYKTIMDRINEKGGGKFP